jgi:hypothetical protein
MSGSTSVLQLLFSGSELRKRTILRLNKLTIKIATRLCNTVFQQPSSLAVHTFSECLKQLQIIEA